MAPSEDLEGVAWGGRDVAFWRGWLCGPVTCGQNSHSEIDTTEWHLQHQDKPQSFAFGVNKTQMNASFQCYFSVNKPLGCSSFSVCVCVCVCVCVRESLHLWCLQVVAEFIHSGIRNAHVPKHALQFRCELTTALRLREREKEQDTQRNTVNESNGGLWWISGDRAENTHPSPSTRHLWSG